MILTPKLNATTQNQLKTQKYRNPFYKRISVLFLKPYDFVLWRRRESNPRPETPVLKPLRV